MEYLPQVRWSGRVVRPRPAISRARSIGGLRLWLAPLILSAALTCRAHAADPSDTRRRLDQVEAFRIRKEWAAMDSLATAVRIDLEKAAHPDSALLAEAWLQSCRMRASRKL